MKNEIEKIIRAELAAVGTNVTAIERKMGLKKWTITKMLYRGSLRYDIAIQIAAAIGKKIEWV